MCGLTVAGYYRERVRENGGVWSRVGAMDGERHGRSKPQSGFGLDRAEKMGNCQRTTAGL